MKLPSSSLGRKSTQFEEQLSIMPKKPILISPKRNCVVRIETTNKERYASVSFDIDITLAQKAESMNVTVTGYDNPVCGEEVFSQRYVNVEKTKTINITFRAHADLLENMHMKAEVDGKAYATKNLNLDRVQDQKQEGK